MTSMLLLVDDDPIFLQNAQELLDAGAGILFAGDAAHAKALMDCLGPGLSVVMIDLDLPGTDGFTLISEIRQRFPALPIIAISGVFQQHVLESAKVVGATDTLCKPVSPEWNSALARFRQNSCK